MAKVRIEDDGEGKLTLMIDREEKRNSLDRETLNEMVAGLPPCAPAAA